MLRAVLATASERQRAGVEFLLERTNQALLLETFEGAPNLEAFKRFARAHGPQVMFLDLERPPALAFVEALRAALPGIQVVGLLEEPAPARIIAAMRAGVAEILYPPYAEDAFTEALARLEDAARRGPRELSSTELVYAFLPGKAGDGCSVVAVNAALALARLPDNEVLLADFDLLAGTTRFLLKLQNAFSAHDALEKAPELDGVMWSEIVTMRGTLAVLGSGEIRKTVDQAGARVRQVIDFARRQYRAVCCDLSGQTDETCVEALSEARRGFLVVAPELASVYLAREKVRYLKTLGLDDRLSVIVNRHRKESAINLAGIEELLGLPIQHTLPEDAAAVQTALLEGVEVAPGSALGREFTKLAYALSDARALRKAEAPKQRMVDYFTITPGKYTLLGGR